MRHRETEVKLPVANLAAVRKQLRTLGFRTIHRRSLEDNVLYDTPDRLLRQARTVLRLRQYGSRSVLTYKGTPDQDQTYKSRIELETEVDDAKVLHLIFGAIGLRRAFRYQKFRTQYAVNAGEERGGEISLDETPAGNFLELEGSRSWIDRVARGLGFSRRDYITASYGALYLEDCRKRGVPAGDMMLAKRSSRSASKRRRSG
jgi:adenylate cyclase, class 2